MTRDELKQIILTTYLAPYGEHATPALRQQFAISAGQAADKILASDTQRRYPARTVKVMPPVRKAG
jgi:hypothetical protein